jgi:hypothetical protein
VTAVENHRWTLRVRATAAGGATVLTRKHRFEVGAPVEFDEAGDRVTALEYFFGALGADLVAGFSAIAQQRGVRLDHVEALVQGELNDPLAAIGVVGANGHPGVERIRVKLHVSSPDAAAALEEIWERARATSPLFQTFRSAIAIDLSLQIGE